jgi:hypothetical protein
MAASYPASVKVFTSKNAGDLIPAAHINDLQDEVAAIESGLLNGTAPLASSNASVANLSVSGGSTLGALSVTSLSLQTVQAMSTSGSSFAGHVTVNGDLYALGSLLQASTVSAAALNVTSTASFNQGVQFSSNCTIAGTLTVATIVSTSIPTVAGVTSYVKAVQTAAQALGSTDVVVVSFDLKSADLLSEFSTATQTFTPQSSGYYSLVGRAHISGSSDGGARLGLYVNSTLVAQDYDGGVGARPARTAQVNALTNLSSGATGQVTLRVQCAGSSNITLSTGAAVTTLEILRIF